MMAPRLRTSRSASNEPRPRSGSSVSTSKSTELSTAVTTGPTVVRRVPSGSAKLGKRRVDVHAWKEPDEPLEWIGVHDTDRHEAPFLLFEFELGSWRDAQALPER